MIRRRHGRVRVLVLGVVVLGLAGPVAAQDDSPAVWGPGLNSHFVNALEFHSVSPDTSFWKLIELGFWSFDGLSGKCYATVRLPTGSLVHSMQILYWDNDSEVDKDIFVGLYREWFNLISEVGRTRIGAEFRTFGAPGIWGGDVDFDPDHTILPYDDGFTVGSYVLEYSSPVTSSDLALRGVVIIWTRQVSPAPAVATFNDVPVDSFGFRHIEALAASGITAGCGGGNFCPDRTATRAELAVFLAKALGLHWPEW